MGISGANMYYFECYCISCTICWPVRPLLESIISSDFKTAYLILVTRSKHLP